MIVKSKYAKFVAILLCSIVLFSSLGLTLNMHLCQGKVKTISLIGKAPKCVGMDEGSICKTDIGPTSFTKKKCCSDAALSFETSTKEIRVTSINNETVQLVVGINPYHNITSNSTLKSNIVRYIPPPDDNAGRTLLVRHQTFLI